MSSQAKKKKAGEAAAQKKPLVINYDADGNKIGDDGYAMTSVRTRMHRIFNAYFVWAVIAAVLGCLCTVLAYAQGAQYSSWELVATGGNQLAGWDLAFLMRMEALMCLYTALTSLLVHFWGFRWFYDRQSETRLKVLLGFVVGASVAFCAVCFVQIDIPEPLAIVNVALVVLTSVVMSEVKAERPNLKKPKIANSVVKH